MATRVKAENLWSNYPTHPGLVLREEIEARGLTQKALAERMRRPPQVINEICKGKKGISAGTALALEGAIGDGPSATFWMNLQARYELAVARLRRHAV